MILFVSGRCDIPAFYSEWFIRRYREGFVDVRNPYNPHMISRIPINPINIDCIIFCTKNPVPLLKYIQAIKIPFFFHVTVTPYHNNIEPYVNKKNIINTLKQLSKIIGSDRLILRYDPIFLNQQYTVAFHEKAFQHLCEQLEGSIKKIIISFVDMYKNTRKHMNESMIYEMNTSSIKEIAQVIGKIAYAYHIDVQTCAELISLDEFHIHKGLCVNKYEIEQVIGRSLSTKGSSIRKNCDCLQTVDIGDYNCCRHMCKYCYANYDETKININMQYHDPKSSVLIGNITKEDHIIVREDKKIQQIQLL